MEKYLVTQKNELVEAHHKDPLSVNEQKVILTMVSMIEPSDDELQIYTLSVKEFSEMVGLNGKSAYTEIKNMAETLVTKVIEIPIGRDDWLISTWASSVRYRKEEGLVEFAFDLRLKPYLIQLKNQFTSYKLSNILNLNSPYSIRLYELMKKWENVGHWESSIEDLKILTGVENKKSYDIYGNFKKRVLNPALLELNEKTDVNIITHEIKEGRKVVRIKFVIRHASEKDIKIPKTSDKKSVENEDIRFRLNELAEKEFYQFDRKYFKELYEAASFIWSERAETELSLLIRYVNVETSIQNPLGFIKSKVKTAWEDFERGEKVTFSELKQTITRPKGRTEVIPSWFQKNSAENEPKEEIDKEEIEKRREALRRDLNMMSENLNKHNS